MRFENIPEWVTERVSQECLRLRNDTADRRYLRAASWVIAYYLGKDVTSDFFVPRGDNQKLFHKYVNAVVLVGETLFLMRGQSGFVTLCERLRQRDFRATYFEMLAAKQFLRAGYEIVFRSEIRALGHDFDFSAQCNGEIVNVEVKALTAPAYSPATVINALGRARKQLPGNAPSVIYCALNDQWAGRESADWNFRLMALGNQFLRGTRRVNAVVFWIEQSVDIPSMPGGGVLAYVSNFCFNVNPYFPIGNLGFIAGGKWGNAAKLAALSEGELDKEIAAANNSEFFRWVDHLTELNGAGYG